MSGSRVLALATLFLATTVAQAEWKEFTFPAGNFKVVFPESPQRLRGARRNLHQFSAAAGAESYGVAYADYSRGTLAPPPQAGPEFSMELAIRSPKRTAATQ